MFMSNDNDDTKTTRDTHTHTQMHSGTAVCARSTLVGGDDTLKETGCRRRNEAFSRLHMATEASDSLGRVWMTCSICPESDTS